MDLTLYPWQKECIETWFACGGRGIVNVVTGAGKTIFALAAAKRLEETEKRALRVKIVVPTVPLMKQWDHALKSFLGASSAKEGEIGHFGGGRKETDRKYMIYVINSARYHLARHVLEDLKQGHAVLLIADECHRYASGENRKIFEFVPYVKQTKGKYYAIGLSATPEAEGYKEVLIPSIGKEIYRYGFASAAAVRQFCPFCIYHISLPFSKTEMSEYQELSDHLLRIKKRLFSLCRYLADMDSGAFFSQLRMLAGEKGEKAKLAGAFLGISYKRKRLVCSASSRAVCVSDLIKRLEGKEKIIIFGERIEQAEQVYRVLSPQYPGRVGRYHSCMGEQANKNVLERFRDGSVRILITCKALDEGIDVPDVSVGIILSGTSAKRQRIQRLGRILRKSEGKEIACLYYLFIRDSGEEPSFFPKKGDYFTACNLSYEIGNRSFRFPEYERAAALLLEEFSQQGAGDLQLEEAGVCLETGIVRPDWLIDRDVLRKKAESAVEKREKNYWICAGRLAQKRASCHFVQPVLE